MKPIVKHTILIAITALLLVLWFVGDRLAADNRREITCKGVVAVIADSADRAFVKAGDIVSFMEDYGTYVGLRLDSVDLHRVEAVIDGKSAVKKSQAWLTDDGVLHVELSQRQPVVRFDDGTNGYYADATGFVFPLQSQGSADVPVVNGHIPMKIPRGFKGTPADAAEKAWLDKMIGLINTITGTVWEHNIVKITVNTKRDLVLTPREGQEQFIFGEPVRVQEKLRLMKAYYESVVPARPGYRTVDLRYRGQLVCRK